VIGMRVESGPEHDSLATARPAPLLAPAREARPVDWVECGCWLSDEWLLLVGGGNAPPRAAFLATSAGRVPLEVRCLSCGTGDHPELDDVLVTLVRCPQPLKSAGLELSSTAQTLTLDPPTFKALLTDLKTLLRERLAALAPEHRTRLMEFLVGTRCADASRVSSLRLSKDLRLAREALRQRFPRCIVGKDQLQGLNIETLLAVDENTFYIRGWARDAEAELTGLTAVSPEGDRVELLERVFRYPRPDLEKLYGTISQGPPGNRLGFLAQFTLAAPSPLPGDWVVEMSNAAGTRMEVKAPPLIRDRAVARNTVLNDLIHDRSPRNELITNHVHPVLARVMEQHQKTVAVASVTQFGKTPGSPEVSVIVPLYRRLDFLEHQLAQFVRDPNLRRVDLVYVLDSPELTESLLDGAEQLFRLYRVPFRVVALECNTGFSLANNVGAGLARGRLLVLMNSDVLPDRPGWLPALAAFHDAHPRIGALGPKLLYEDDSLQHAGMYFQRLPRSSLWSNQHYFKGFHRQFAAANVARPVPAVTAACLMIDRGLYHDLGGLRGVYVQGDYEDSDLCMRLLEAGRENWYLPQVELYHLEGQSYPQPLRESTGRYNCWLHTRFWDSTIERVMGRYGERP
jgi:GT2 family glycosyltransferase